MTTSSNLVFLYFSIRSLNNNLKFDLVSKYCCGNFKIKCNIFFANKLHRPIFFRFPSSHCITNSRKLLFVGVKNMFLDFKIFKQVAWQIIEVFFVIKTKFFNNILLFFRYIRLKRLYISSFIKLSLYYTTIFYKFNQKFRTKMFSRRVFGWKYYMWKRYDGNYNKKYIISD